MLMYFYLNVGFDLRKCILKKYTGTARLCVKAVTEPNSAESTEITESAVLRLFGTVIKLHYRFDLECKGNVDS